jgi:hypothetical protein
MPQPVIAAASSKELGSGTAGGATVCAADVSGAETTWGAVAVCGTGV